MKGFYSIYMKITDEVEEIIREALYHDSGEGRLLKNIGLLWFGRTQLFKERVRGHSLRTGQGTPRKERVCLSVGSGAKCSK
jgi:hypothetical protein